MQKFCGKILGQALVEFALVLPMLALLLFAIIQYGFIFAAYITVRNAAAVGARQAIINSNNAVNAAQDALAPMLVPSLATTTLTTTNLASGPAFSLKVSYPLPIIIPFVVPGGAKTKTISATTIIR